MTTSALRLERCKACNATPPNWRAQRTVFIFADCVKTRCNNCGAIEIFEKAAPEFQGCAPRRKNDPLCHLLTRRQQTSALPLVPPGRGNLPARESGRFHLGTEAGAVCRAGLDA